MEGFSIIYSAYTQRRFLESLDKGDLEKAVEALERMLHGVTPIEEGERLKVKLEGYRMIVSKIPRGVTTKSLEELGEYRRLGTIEALEEAVELLAEYRLSLEEYRETGTIEEFRELKEVSRRLENL